MLAVDERYELLQDQVDVLSLKLRESNKWQKALEKWLRNTFKLDVSELVRNDSAESDEEDGLAYAAEISIISPEPQTNGRKRRPDSHHGAVQIPKTQPRFLPPLHRIITNANNQPQVQTTSSSTSNFSIQQNQRQMSHMTANPTATNKSLISRNRVKTKIVPGKVTQTNNSSRPRLDPPTVSITALPPTPEESDFNYNNSNTILILPSEKVSSFCHEDTEINESPNQQLNLNQYVNDDDIEIVETRSIVKDETRENPNHSSRRTSVGVTDESNSQYEERGMGSEENSNSYSSAIPSSSQNKLECDDFYMFNIRGDEDSMTLPKSDSEMDISFPKNLYENYVEGTPLQFVKSEKGYNQLVFDGYLFGKERGSVGKIMWKCTWYTKSGCKGRCHTVNNFVLYHSNNHNHSRELAKIASKKVFSLE